MRERPIHFSGGMCRALLDGRKTQTRRICKPQPRIVDVAGAFHSWVFPRRERGMAGLLWPNAREQVLGLCPYGAPGDRLYVKESYRYANWTEDGYPKIEYRDGHYQWCDRIPDEWGEKLTGIWEQLSARENFEIDGRAADRRWRPSIHMPRWASRITLEIIAVRVERLQDISEADAMREGDPKQGLIASENTHIDWYRALWERIHGHDSWRINPWVWVVSFRRVQS